MPLSVAVLLMIFCSSTEFAQLLPIKPHDAPFHSEPILVWKMHTVALLLYHWSLDLNSGLQATSQVFYWLNFPGLNFLSFLYLRRQNVSPIELTFTYSDRMVWTSDYLVFTSCVFLLVPKIVQPLSNFCWLKGPHRLPSGTSLEHGGMHISDLP